MREIIAWWALLFAIASFALYLVTAVVQLLAQLSIGRNADRRDTFLEVTSFLTAIKELAEALSKASPSLLALIASISYLAMAGLAAGVFGQAD